MKKKFMVASLLLALITSNALACTRIFYNNDKSNLKIVARNEDYVSSSDPTLVITPRGIERSVKQEKNGAHWTGIYGNVAVYANNQFPMDGINEKGLTARTLYFSEGIQEDQAGKKNNQPILDGDYWVSYVLDNFATVDEAVDALKNNVTMNNIKRNYEYSASPKHLSIADASGDSAIIEIQNGELKIFHGSEYTVLTNPSKYQDMLKAYEEFKKEGRDIPGTLESEDRFIRAQFYLEHLSKPNDRYAAYGYLNQVLGTVSMPVGTPLPGEDSDVIAQIKPLVRHPEKMKGNGTYWSSISDLTNLEYRFKSAESPSDVYIDLKEINFDMSEGVRVIPMLDEHAQRGIFGDLKSEFLKIDGDIYDQQAN